MLIFYLHDWQDFVMCSDPSCFDIDSSVWILRAKMYLLMRTFRKCLSLFWIGIAVFGLKIARLFDAQVRFLQVYFHLIESKNSINLFIVSTVCFVSVTLLRNLTINITPRPVLGTTLCIVINILHMVISSLFLSVSGL